MLSDLDQIQGFFFCFSLMRDSFEKLERVSELPDCNYVSSAPFDATIILPCLSDNIRLCVASDKSNSACGKTWGSVVCLFLLQSCILGNGHFL